MMRIRRSVARLAVGASVAAGLTGVIGTTPASATDYWLQASHKGDSARLHYEYQRIGDTIWFVIWARDIRVTDGSSTDGKGAYIHAIYTDRSTGLEDVLVEGVWNGTKTRAYWSRDYVKDARFYLCKFTVFEDCKRMTT